VLDLDYDRYAAAEACLGWVNVAGAATLPPGRAGEWVRLVGEGIGRAARAAATDVAHVKCLVATDHGLARGHLVSSEESPTVIVEGEPSGGARALLNARVAAPPEVLSRWVYDAIASANAATGVRFSPTGDRALSPARPTPTYRLAPVKSGNRFETPSTSAGP
jgi:hypothetical protein